MFNIAEAKINQVKSNKLFEFSLQLLLIYQKTHLILINFGQSDYENAKKNFINHLEH